MYVEDTPGKERLFSQFGTCLILPDMDMDLQHTSDSCFFYLSNPLKKS